MTFKTENRQSLLIHKFTDEENICHLLKCLWHHVLKVCPISPNSLHMDELLQRLQKQDIGCHIGTIFMGALCYADDLITLCPTRRGLQKMINVCQEFAYEHDVVFNPKKTVCMFFSCKTIPNDIDIYLGREKLRWVLI